MYDGVALLFCCHVVYIIVMMYCLLFFFFQAEDGIRDLVRSRGLGDVYKRQVPGRGVGAVSLANFVGWMMAERLSLSEALSRVAAVSYTHLTLPTSDLV